MKNLLITVLFSVLALTTIQAKDTSSVEVCKTYIGEAKSFQATMKSDKISEEKLAFAKENVVAHCGSIVSKKSYKVESFAKGLYKKDTATANNCKTAIAMAKSYDERVNKTPFMANAYKVNVVHNCGTLASKKAPEFSLFGITENSKEDLKNSCLASIEKAHSATGTAVIDTYKNEVVANCGKLQANI